jgi:hypothetical protein
MCTLIFYTNSAWNICHCKKNSVPFYHKCTTSSCKALDVVGGQSHTPAALPTVNTRCPQYRRLRECRGRSGKVRKVSPSQEFEPQTAQLVASRYTKYAVPADIGITCLLNLTFRPSRTNKTTNRYPVLTLALHTICCNLVPAKLINLGKCRQKQFFPCIT